MEREAISASVLLMISTDAVMLSASASSSTSASSAGAGSSAGAFVVGAGAASGASLGAAPQAVMESASIAENRIISSFFMCFLLIVLFNFLVRKA